MASKQQKAKFVMGAFACIFDENKKVLLCHRRDYDLWNLPGGGVEKNETPWQAVIRETKEETGLEVKIKKISGIYYKSLADEIVFNFICEINGGKITITDEADDIRFFDYKNLPKNIAPKQKERILDVFENNNKIILKTQKEVDILKNKIHLSKL